MAASQSTTERLAPSVTVAFLTASPFLVALSRRCHPRPGGSRWHDANV